MSTSAVDDRPPVKAVRADVSGSVLTVELSDGRAIRVDLDAVRALHWLRDADAAKRSHWEIEPHGFAVYWPELDDGVEVRHLLDPLVLSQNRSAAG
jgi:Protein of unknown function (DUF2442)